MLPLKFRATVAKAALFFVSFRPAKADSFHGNVNERLRPAGSRWRKARFYAPNCTGQVREVSTTREKWQGGSGQESAVVVDFMLQGGGQMINIPCSDIDGHALVEKTGPIAADGVAADLNQ